MPQRQDKAAQGTIDARGPASQPDGITGPTCDPGALTHTHRCVGHSGRNYNGASDFKNSSLINMNYMRSHTYTLLSGCTLTVDHVRVFMYAASTRARVCVCVRV